MSIFYQIMLLCAVGVGAARGVLRFNSQGTFKITQFTDTHMSIPVEDELTVGVEAVVLASEHPDLAVLTGDILSGPNFDCPVWNTSTYERLKWEEVMAPFKLTKVPWAITFGNHDDQGELTREQLMTLDISLGSLSQFGPTDVFGVSNYYIPIYAADSDKIMVVLYFLAVSDTGSCDGVAGDGCVTASQVQWYQETSTALTAANGGVPIYSLMFFHIPLPQFVTLWNTEVCYGSKNENTCCPSVDTGLYSTALKMGDVHGMFVGHDHTNDFCGTFSDAPQLMLCYGRKTGFNSYNPPVGMLHGARVIQLVNSPTTGISFTTWIRNSLGRREDLAKHSPTGPGQEECVD